MQAGLMNTYQTNSRTRGWMAWVAAALLTGFYVDLYFFDHFTPVAKALRLPDKWFLYGLLYSLGMIVGGWFMLQKHGNSRYHRIRTYSLVSVQVLLGFSLPLVMKILANKDYYLSYMWPLKQSYLFPSTLKDMPAALAIYFIVGSLIAFPLLGYFKGKRFYCSWVCGCGGLAETFGDPWRHLSDKSTRAWKIEQFSIYAVLALILIVTGVQIADAAGGGNPGLHTAAQKSDSLYGLFIGSIFSGVIGVGLYPVMGTRVWCRFGCPMAAMLGLIQKFGRFRITVKKDMCISCGNCSTYCEMGIDVRQYAMKNMDIKRASCVGCGMCAHVCPRGVLKLETKKDSGPGANQGEWVLDL